MPSDEAIGIFLAERHQRAMDTVICAFLGRRLGNNALSEVKGSLYRFYKKT